jgi:uncharacterized membrane protein YeiH
VTPPISLSFLLPIEFDLVATFLMATTGVWAASRRGYDAVGAFVMAFVAGVGGGLMRDSIFLSQAPAIMQDPRYLAAVLAAVLAGGATQRFAQRSERLMAYVDAIAIGVYGVVGADKALAAGIPPVGAILVGMCNAVGGGLIRDILVREEPLVFKPGQLYVLAALGGCVLFVYLKRRYGFDVQDAAWIAIATTLVLRLLAIRFNWTTRPFSSWDAWNLRRRDGGGGP